MFVVVLVHATVNIPNKEQVEEEIREFALQDFIKQLYIRCKQTG